MKKIQQDINTIKKVLLIIAKKFKCNNELLKIKNFTINNEIEK